MVKLECSRLRLEDYVCPDLDNDVILLPEVVTFLYKGDIAIHTFIKFGDLQVFRVTKSVPSKDKFQITAELI